MGERQNHKGKAVIGHGTSGMFGSLPAQELLQQLQRKAPVTRNFLPEQRSYRSQHLHQWSPASPSRGTSGSRWPPRAALAWGNQGNKELLLRCGHPGFPHRVRCVCVCERGRCAGTDAFLLHQPWLWLLKRVLEGHKYASLQEEENPRAGASSPLACPILGDQSKWEVWRGWDGQSSNLLIMLRDTEIKRQLYKLIRPPPGQSLSRNGWAGGEHALMSKLPLLHQPVGQVLGSCKQTLWSSSLEFISVVPYSYSISAIRPVFNQAVSLP